MPLEINLTLSDADLRQFQDLVDESRSAMDKHQTPEQIEAAAKKLQEAQAAAAAT